MRKVIVIIGASDGIGKTTLTNLLANDNIVYNLSRTKIDKLSTNIYCDVSKTETIKIAIDHVLEVEKKIDSLIYCAGFSMASPIEDVKEEDYRYLFEVILFGYVETLKCLLVNFKTNNGGRIIFMSSLASSIPIPYDPYYSAAKAAVEVFNNSVNIELNKYSIYITNLIFGGVKTNFTYKRKVYNESKTYSYDFFNAVDSLALIEQKGLDSAMISKAVEKILNMKNPPLNYVVGFKDNIVYKLSKILPAKMVNSAVKFKFKINN